MGIMSNRVNVYSRPDEDDYLSEPVLLGWFDIAKADKWSDADYNGNGSGGTGRGQAVYRTSGGRWVLSNWSRWQGERDSFEFITPERAREWLLQNECDDAVEKHFGDIPEEEDRRPGRPEVGGLVNVRLGAELLAMVDGYAGGRDISRAEAVRRLVTDAVTRERVASSAPLSARDNR